MAWESVPPWLELLLTTQFFAACATHVVSSRNECNLFCIECQTPPVAFCHHCFSSHHSSHRVIQVRRSSYHDVVRIHEVEDILDISDVQTYVINRATVVFLNERPQVRGPCITAIKGTSSRNCEICNRGLIDDAFRFCSLGCNLKSIKRDKEATARDVIDLDSVGKDKDSEDSCSDNDANTEAGAESSFQATGSRKRAPSTTVTPSHRRKGIPHRAPFF